MGTLVCFHAHPDDEAVSTGGTIAKAAAAGHRVVLVVATGGEFGEAPDDLRPGESLVARRRNETLSSAKTLGIARVVWLGYRDSGMTGWEQNSDPASFLRADVEQAAQRLADLLTQEKADVVTVYDWHGNYGHPDHIQVHRVGHRAAELAGTPNVYEATMNRDHIARIMATARIAPPEGATEDSSSWTDDGLPMGMSEAELTTKVDVSEFVWIKRDALASHASQVTDSRFFLEMPHDAFAASFGTEWFIHKGRPPGITEEALAGLD
jgi:LmbE family N-acetylglucosaminyl deacetylase